MQSEASRADIPRQPRVDRCAVRSSAEWLRLLALPAAGQPLVFHSPVDVRHQVRR
jgi:hypothetical protein